MSQSHVSEKMIKQKSANGKSWKIIVDFIFDHVGTRMMSVFFTSRNPSKETDESCHRQVTSFPLA